MRVFKATYRDRKGKVCESAKWYAEFRDHLERVRRLPAKKRRKNPGRVENRSKATAVQARS